MYMITYKMFNYASIYVIYIYILYYNLNLSYISIYRPWNFNEIHGYIRLVIESHASSSCNDLFLVIWCEWLWLPDYLGILWALGIANVQDCHHICHQRVGYWGKTGQRFGRGESDELPWCMKPALKNYAKNTSKHRTRHASSHIKQLPFL